MQIGISSATMLFGKTPVYSCHSKIAQYSVWVTVRTLSRCWVRRMSTQATLTAFIFVALRQASTQAARTSCKNVLMITKRFVKNTNDVRPWFCVQAQAATGFSRWTWNFERKTERVKCRHGLTADPNFPSSYIFALSSRTIQWLKRV